MTDTLVDELNGRNYVENVFCFPEKGANLGHAASLLLAAPPKPIVGVDIYHKKTTTQGHKHHTRKGRGNGQNRSVHSKKHTNTQNSTVAVWSPLSV